MAELQYPKLGIATLRDFQAATNKCTVLLVGCELIVSKNELRRGSAVSLCSYSLLLSHGSYQSAYGALPSSEWHLNTTLHRNARKSRCEWQNTGPCVQDRTVPFM